MFQKGPTLSDKRQCVRVHRRQESQDLYRSTHWLSVAESGLASHNISSQPPAPALSSAVAVWLENESFLESFW